MSRSSLIVLALVLVSPCALAQTPWEGFRLFGANNGSTVELRDPANVVVHSWTGSSGGASYYVLDDGTLLRTYTPAGAPSGYPGGAKGGVERLALDGTVLWQYEHIGPGFLQHHDIEPLPNGNVLMISWDDWTVAEAIAAGRDPALISGNIFRPEYIIEVQPTGPTTGAIVWEWHVADHVVQDHDPNQANFGVVSAHPELVNINYPPLANEAHDWIHMNSIDYDPVHDLILMSANRQAEIWIIDHSTTTTEAAGHTGGNYGKGGDLLYRWGNPAAYDSGTLIDQQLVRQHGPIFIPQGYPGAGNVILFNNQIPGGSQVNELVLPQDATGAFSLNASGTYDPVAPAWTHTGGFQSNIVSNVERLPNGNTLICSGQEGFVFEIDPFGSTVWSHTQPGLIFQAHHVSRTLWADSETISATAGGTITFDLITGSGHVGETYWLLGSASGTSPGIVYQGLTLPLVQDDYTLFTLLNPNSPNLGQTFGALDGFGRAVATFDLPGGLLPASVAGLELHHAFAVLSGASLVLTSNAVPLVFGP